MRGLLRAAAAAAVIGAAAGLAVWVFQRSVDLAELLSHGWYAPTWTDVGVPWIVLVPVIGGLLVGLILHGWDVPEEPGHGVAEVIETVTVGSTRFPERRMPGKAALAALSLGSGASLGPEDPAVEIGGGIGSWLARRFGLATDAQQALIAAGAAAGLAAAFQAPLAAIAFAFEVFAFRLRSRAMLLVGISAGAALLVLQLPAPEQEPVVPGHGFGTGWELPAALLLGCLAGVVSAGQIGLTHRLEHAVIAWRTPPRWAKPAMGGAVLGLVGVFAPELVGIGYELLAEIAAGALPAVRILILLAAGKLLLTAVSFGTGFLGGFFAPCLFIGATAGAAYGVGASLLAGDLRPEVLALAGMAAMLAGCVRAPLTAVLLLAALSGSYALVPVLLAAALPAHHLSHVLQRHSLYTYAVEDPAESPPPDPAEGDPQSDTSGGTASAEG